MTKTKYRICIGRSTMELELQVEDLIKLGYVPQGGVSLAPDGQHSVYAQAMVRHEPQRTAESNCG